MLRLAILPLVFASPLAGSDAHRGAANHAVDYKLPPVIVRVRWRGVGGSGTFELKTMLANY